MSSMADASRFICWALPLLIIAPGVIPRQDSAPLHPSSFSRVTVLPVHALLSAVLTLQTPAPAQPSAPAQTTTPEEAASSAERAAASAERAAAAAERAA